MNKKWWFGTAMATVMVSSVLVGCGGGEKTGAGDKQELHLVIGDDVPSMDPSKATDEYSFDMLSATLEGLVRLDKDGNAQPGLASKWEVSDDAKTYTFTLRDGLKWSNGDAVTAKDFEYSWKRTLNPDTGSQYSFMLFWVKGASAYNSGTGSADQVGVQAVDDKTLKVTLENPTPFFLNQMAFPTFYPQNQKFVEEQGDKYGSSPETILSVGPFQVKEWVRDASITLTKSDTYWDKDAVKLDSVTFQVVKDSNSAVNMYDAGEIDRVGLVREHIDRFKDTPEYTQVPELTNGYLIFNPTVKGLDNAKIRKALTYAVDRDMYADIIYHNGTVGATGFVPVGTSDSAGGQFRDDAGDTLPKVSADDAKKLFEEGLKEVGMTASDFKLKLLVDDSDVARKAAEFLQEQWKTKLGIAVDPEAVPFKLRLQRESKMDYQVGISLWGADYNDPMTFLDLFVSGGDFNKVGYKSEQYDKLIQEAKVTSDVKKRAQLLVEAEKVLMDDMPVGPIFFRGRAYATKPYVKNFVSFPYGVGFDLKTTYIEGKE
ncbi:MAG TPA: peptide ABC transporter substrate-binding protein [Bacilli bacterium]|nr:peptide ABC transporter substrate-binding protein [Bacilli bacterium]